MAEEDKAGASASKAKTVHHVTGHCGTERDDMHGRTCSSRLSLQHGGKRFSPNTCRLSLMVMSLLSSFSCLDDIIQIIHQGSNSFVVASSVSIQDSDSAWNVHLGLKGYGRWWKGSWTEEDVQKLLGGKHRSPQELDGFARRLRQTIVRGDLDVTAWDENNADDMKHSRLDFKSANRGTYQLTLGPNAKRPLHVLLTELKRSEALAYTTNFILAIAAHASRLYDCQLYPLSGAAPTIIADLLLLDVGMPISNQGDFSEDPSQVAKERRWSGDSSVVHGMPDAGSSRSASPASGHPTRAKGVSLANPSKKARRYQPLSFGDENDE
ncbi:hypothetical protein FISHEDRAFT_54814 [Fistulina hepatica ATCC 64428]|uniref:Uncharacterized protein n=1 Tax=Fistulina hepatica ATCC 64428 TaxID=1128425 RepID=A0A0D7AQ64_9AGAR|nr:hypothetical protein FISHEDRAFT_54814 [Fistulina hepatica ATCC 64428]